MIDGHGHVASRGDDADPRLGQPLVDELLGEVVACRKQEVGSPQREAIERRLGPCA